MIKNKLIDNQVQEQVVATGNAQAPQDEQAAQESSDEEDNLFNFI
jgi:hypothetical protein